MPHFHRGHGQAQARRPGVENDLLRRAAVRPDLDDGQRVHGQERQPGGVGTVDLPRPAVDGCVLLAERHPGKVSPCAQRLDRAVQFVLANETVAELMRGGGVTGVEGDGLGQERLSVGEAVGQQGDVADLGGREGVARLLAKDLPVGTLRGCELALPQKFVGIPSRGRSGVCRVRADQRGDRAGSECGAGTLEKLPTVKMCVCRFVLSTSIRISHRRDGAS
ncbi:hypothetical protein [Nonomuraea rubra]|uniref:Uncharacterized protein n=1 Tax=Nonomuraea rubra TaxID=46180 RepID=A0A7X0P1H3_9ACTN|nr:hypothetical protein [Nonomuraea rubra]MBB6553542.1 hypothetical protein [Nonomuraea rubra]